MAGVLVVMLALAGSLGFMSFCGVAFNVATIQVVPFLLLGLGVNDMFILMHSYAELTRTRKELKPAELIATVVGRTGPAVTLTTLVNFIALMLGQTMGLEIVSAFSLMAGVGVLFIFIVLICIFGGLLAMHAFYVASASGTPAKLELPATPQDGSESPARRQRRSSFERAAALKMGVFERVVLPAFTEGLLHPAGRVVIVLGIGAFLITAGLQFENVDLGLPIKELFPSGSSEFHFMETYEEKFGLVVNTVVLKTSDWAYTHPFLGSLSDPTRYSLQTEMAARADGHLLSIPTWYHAMVEWALPCSWNAFYDFNNASEPAETQALCAAFFGSSALYNPRCEENDPLGGGKCGPKMSAAAGNFFPLDNSELSVATVMMYYSSLFDAAYGETAPLTTNGVPVCTAWPAEYLLCGGVSCFKDLADMVNVSLGSLMAIHPKYFYECLDVMVNYDTKWKLVTSGFQCDEPGDGTDGGSRSCGAVDSGARRIHRPDGDMSYSTFQSIGYQLKDTGDHVELIKNNNAACSSVKKSVGIDAYSTSTQTTWYSSFVTLEDDLFAGVGFALLAVVIAVALMLLATQPPAEPFAARVVAALWTAVLLGGSVLAIVFLTAGCMGASGLYLNCFTAVTLIMGVGVAVEFTVHLGIVYLASAGSPQERAASALKHMLLPMIDGSVSTFLGLLPLAFSPFDYIVSYYFELYAILIAIGLVIGVVFLPVVLATVGYRKVL